MPTVGIRELRDRLSHYLREVERTGAPLTITDHGRPVAELIPADPAPRSHLGDLVARGLLRPASDPSPLRLSWPNIHLPPGTAQQLIDEDRGER